MNSRFLGALAAYVTLAGLAFWLLSGLVLKAVLILFAGLLLKTVIAWKAGW